MKVLVTGGRDFNNRIFVHTNLDFLHKETPITCLVHGGARGVDTYAGEWAKGQGIEQRVYKVTKEEWDRHPGKSAAILRNIKMLDTETPELVVAFPGKNGTAHMVGYADKKGYEIKEFKVAESPKRTFARVPQDGYNRIAILADGVSFEDFKAGGPLLGTHKALIEDAAFAAGFNIWECLITALFMEPVSRVIEDHFFTKTQAHHKDIQIAEERGYYLQANRHLFLAEDYDFELDRLSVELQRWKPRVTIAMGSVAQWALTFESRLNKRRGRFSLNELTGWGYVLSTYSPGATTFDKRRIDVLIDDFKLAAQRAKYRLPPNGVLNARS